MKRIVKSMCFLAGWSQLVLCLTLHAADQNAWRFGITPYGEPMIVLTLVKFPYYCPAFRGFTARHQLIFDGQCYMSRILIPELNSYLIPAGNQFHWRKLDGTNLELELEKRTLSNSHTWTLTRKSFDTYEISSDDGTESYLYTNCVLVTASIQGWDHKFTYEEGKLVKIERGKGNAQVVAFIEYDLKNSLPIRLTSMNRSLIFSYGDNLELISCHEESSGDSIFGCTYVDGLLHDFITKSTTRTFRWGAFKFTEYFKLAVRFAPIVVADGRFNYSTKGDKKTSTVHFISIDNKISGKWIMDRSTHHVETIYDQKQNESPAELY